MSCHAMPCYNMPCHAGVLLFVRGCREGTQKPQCDAAIKIIRGVVPPQIFEVSKAQLQDMGVPKEICVRIFNKRVLW
jgi:hypothetical protein